MTDHPTRRLRAVTDTDGELADRVQLARSILGHRPWCGGCLPDIRQVQRALDGDTIDDILGQETNGR